MSYVLDYPAAPESPFNPPQDQIITQEAEVVKKRMLSNGIREGEVRLPETIDWNVLFGSDVVSQFTQDDIEALTRYIAGYPMKLGLMQMSLRDKSAFEHISNAMGVSTTERRPSAEFADEFSNAFGEVVNKFRELGIYGNWSQSIRQVTEILENVVRQNCF